MGPLLPGAMITSQNLGNFHVSINSPLDQKHIMSYQPVPKWPSQLWAVCLVSCSLSTSFFFFFFKFFLLFLNFTNCISFAKYQNESATGIHVFPILNPPPSSLLSPHTIPLGRPSALAPSIQYRASNLDWQLISYMILYMFQCHSPKSSHPLPLQQSP